MLAIASSVAQSASAWCPAPLVKACSAYFESDKVFYGTVAKVTPLRDDGKDASGEDPVAMLRYTIDVKQALKGEVKLVETVDTENSSSRWFAGVGERRIVFARHGEAWGLCSPIDEAAHGEQTMRAIQAIAKASKATVEGEVIAGSGPGSPPASGVKVVIVGAGRSYEATTDKRGAFSVAVEPGRYRIASPGLEPTIPYSRADVGGFQVARGQCAQFQLSRMR